MDNFQSFPHIVLRKLSDSDLIPDLKDKIQYNFDQIYLHYVNKILKGEKGDIGYTGLSIKGDKGEKGDKGSIIHFDDVSDGDPVLNPEHNEDDIIITSTGSYYTVVDSGGGALIYSLSFSPSLGDLFVIEADFASLGAVNTHTLLSSGQDGNIILATKDGTTGKYLRTVLGNNIYNSNTIDTLTLVNILDNTSYLSSTESKQLSLRYRDLANGAISLTAFEFFYNIDANAEYKYWGDKIVNMGMAKHTSGVLSGTSSSVINTTRTLFTGGVSNWKLATEADSVVLYSPTTGEWHLQNPMLHKLHVGDTKQVTLSDGKVGINNQSPTSQFDSIGSWKMRTLQGVDLRAYTESTATKSRIGWHDGINDNYAQFGQNEAIVKASINSNMTLTNTLARLALSSSASISLYAGFTESVRSEFLVGSSHMEQAPTYFKWEFYDPFLTVGRQAELNNSGLLINDVRPYDTSLTLRTNIKAVKGTESSYNTGINIPDNWYLTDFSGSSSASPITVPAEPTHDRILYIGIDGGTGVLELTLGGASMLIGRPEVGTFNTFIIPAGRIVKIQSVGGAKTGVRLTVMKFGV